MWGERAQGTEICFRKQIVNLSMFWHHTSMCAEPPQQQKQFCFIYPASQD